MATIRVGDSTTMYCRDWGEGPFVAFRTVGRRILALGTGRCFSSCRTFSVWAILLAFWRRSKGARSNLSSYPRQIELLPTVCQG